MSSPFDTITTPGYSIHIGDSALNQLNSFLKKNKFSSIFILVDEHTLQHCLPVLIANVKQLSEAEVIELESGEKNKTLDVCTNMWRALGELRANRKSLLINLGGGVITDIGGFIAAAFKRGISFVNVPTTLLAMIDASAGGKTGVDLDGLKNEIGFFYDPRELFIFPGFLRTLPKREMLAGFAEALKHGLIADKTYWEFLKTANPGDASHWEELITRSIRIKLSFVEQDPREQGARKALNFGHTIGHAIESYFLERAQTSVLHGEAVAMGMICEAWLSKEYCGMSDEELEEITTNILQHYEMIDLDDVANNRVIELMRHDKKNEKGEISFSLIKNIGQPVINKKIPAADIMEALNYYRFTATHSRN
ncbi:MAG: 3-dehydroquinate synthase [Bacteroidetes bacterium]|nr:3-dehydroquinate synthase [Bacteroidota bacterium]